MYLYIDIWNSNELEKTEQWKTSSLHWDSNTGVPLYMWTSQPLGYEHRLSAQKFETSKKLGRDSTVGFATCIGNASPVLVTYVGLP